ncbi:hypothetical protein I5677_12165 [Mobilitalea sibirica]|uniref:Uncharacterized protein n=1 Tax=Mobilitalea sibirica TaxID=1462919 RepID=A0A8J7L322_9FIRM|nr:hypothetical protein [Mobilitalea sibirica]MBH1941648.1 hypothetical protein [Mobilitalea sibirica]
MANAKLNTTVDTDGIDRLAIGGRLYDMFKCSRDSKIKFDGQEMYMKEQDIIDMFYLVNNDRIIRSKKFKIVP